VYDSAHSCNVTPSLVSLQVCSSPLPRFQLGSFSFELTRSHESLLGISNIAALPGQFPLLVRTTSQNKCSCHLCSAFGSLQYPLRQRIQEQSRRPETLYRLGNYSHFFGRGALSCYANYSIKYLRLWGTMTTCLPVPRVKAQTTQKEPNQRRKGRRGDTCLFPRPNNLFLPFSLRPRMVSTTAMKGLLGWRMVMLRQREQVEGKQILQP